MPDVRATSLRPALGATVLELLVAMAVLAILSSVAVPSFVGVIAANARVAAANQLVGAVAYARSEAIKTGREVVLCPSADGERCDAAGGDWAAGYLIFVHAPGGAPYQVSDPSSRRRADRWPAAIHVQANRDAFVFRPLARRSSNGTFRLCHRTQRTPPRAVIVSPTGRTRTSPRLPGGQTIDCTAGAG